ncbi:MAG: hypothetical protein BJ554DRAFT_4705 [Olpidium bornovanus]|uniref:Chitin-binding type-4 domain-containing protein n=1 Tax=Olpidium bornovanus TaxID=278681 RepID=A0A8H8DFA7_9FUNG|nr:MAG: hypothetical protein BJ554DRAFT_4705 [Olpidium bornovanus]
MRARFASLAAAGVALASTAAGHMEMKNPPSRLSKWSPYDNYKTIDYDNNAPLEADGSNFPCKKYKSKGIVATIKAGSTLPVELYGTAPHSGGHCQFSVSYDGEKNFVVLKTIVHDCMRPEGGGLTPSVQVPADLPPCASCVFAWTWINAVGNREYYMNCADVKIESSAKGSFTGPALTIANLPGYPTVPEFPKSGDPDLHEIFDHDGKITISASGAVSKSGTPISQSAFGKTKKGKDDNDKDSGSSGSSKSKKTKKKKKKNKC